ncbi:MULTISPECIES: phospholipase A [Burkholderia]|uniref:phospholipase A n=1 Tax=Burkholderia TaxID=32008 RepID=UPI0011994C80|nr:MULTISPECIES: phospholipase A [Burkholderia]MDN7738591.1 phospholipase A [Burkholderia gladioli]TWC74126.1 phospholipase A1-like protein [Burkholderia sp. SJZ089]TWD04076.1 phospholipase A1-like protein [Burkholderia sp. SJZ115]TWD09516.1 phospholipase A1-like protein [Burkholderia sp. SJZ091]
MRHRPAFAVFAASRAFAHVPSSAASRHPLGILASAVVLAFAANTAQATVALVQPAREAAADAPLTLTLIYSDDDAKPLPVSVPDTLEVTVTNAEQPPVPVKLVREAGVPERFTLKAGQYRKVRFSAPWPDSARGTVTITPVGFDASAAVVSLNRSANQFVVARAETAEGHQASPAGVAAAASGVAATAGTPQPSGDALTTGARGLLSRISYYEPMYIGVGVNGDVSAKLQFSFKYRLHMPDNPASRSLLDNLYFAYTQTSIWDLSADSKPFRDTSYKPRLFYYVADTGLHSPWFTRMGFAAGIGHESNGKAGPDSRSLNILFVQPTWEFGDLTSYHWQVSPMLYYYLGISDNRDIADYRGYMDLVVKYGSPDGWQLSTTLRKGTHHWYGSVDTKLSYPLAKLFDNAWGGYVWIGYFNGYGEDLLDYNQRQHWIARVGVSIAR